MTLSEIRASVRQVIEDEGGFPDRKFYEWQDFVSEKPLSDSPDYDWIRVEVNGGPTTLISFPAESGIVERRPLLSLEIGVPFGYEAASARLSGYEDVVERIFRPGTVVSGTLRVGTPGPFGFDWFREGSAIVSGISIPLVVMTGPGAS